jgi:CubicO group peptidase (beta-lactamase class C family)
MNDTQLGSSKRLDREVVYYPCGYLAGRFPPVTPIPCGYGTPPIQGKSLFPPHGTVSAAYGGGVHTFSLQASEGAGGMVSTSIDLARFTGAIASGQLPNFQGDILHPGWPQNFYSYSAAESSYEISQGLTNYYIGMGWDWVQPNALSTPLTPLLSYDNNNFEKTTVRVMSDL